MKNTLFALLIAVLSGVAFAGDAMTVEEAAQASGKSADEVKAADANGDGTIDSSEFSALSGAAEEKGE